jgi:hypothetical protein
VVFAAQLLQRPAKQLRVPTSRLFPTPAPQHRHDKALSERASSSARRNVATSVLRPVSGAPTPSDRTMCRRARRERRSFEQAWKGFV